MEVGSMHSLRCYNCGGHHKVSKRMEMRAILTATTLWKGVQSQVRCWAGGVHTSSRTGTQNVNKKVKCISKRQARYVDRAGKQVNVYVGDSVNLKWNKCKS